ncbi:MAG: hypothetical protein GY713_03405 [Actinomycetia bacterium]|nr:hypothetical protein [Actinomycetes bacterium]
MGVVIEQLRAETGEPWRAINLGETGAKVGDAVERQLPLVEQITEVLGPPSLATASIGTNDVMFTLKPRGPAARWQRWQPGFRLSR